MDGCWGGYGVGTRGVYIVLFKMGFFLNSAHFSSTMHSNKNLVPLI